MRARATEGLGWRLPSIAGVMLGLAFAVLAPACGASDEAPARRGDATPAEPAARTPPPETPEDAERRQVESVRRARPAYAADPAEFLRLARAFLREHRWGDGRKEVLALLEDEGPGYVFRHRFWGRVETGATPAEFGVLAYLWEAGEEHVQGTRAVPGVLGGPPGEPWAERLAAWVRGTGASLGMTAHAWEAKENRRIAYQLGRIPLADPSLPLVLETSVRCEEKESAEYRGGGHTQRLTRDACTLDLVLRASGQAPAVFSGTGIDPPLPSMLSAYDRYHTATAQAAEAAARLAVERFGTPFGPIVVSVEAGSLANPGLNLWSACAGLLRDDRGRPATSGGLLRDATKADSLHDLHDEVKAVLAEVDPAADRPR